MDTALTLRLACEKNQPVDDKTALQLLETSSLVSKLTEQPTSENNLSNLFNLVALAEIPFAGHLEHTKELLNKIEQTLATPEGFSYTGAGNDIVPCYNAMLLEAYTRLGLSQSASAQNALNWIKKYQLFEREQQSTWNGTGIFKHGGCLNTVPCYIGIGKTMRALLTYREYQQEPDLEVAELIKQGLAYMLKHRFFLRLSEERPISKHITASAFPQSYFLSLTDLVYIMGKGSVTNDSHAQPLLELLQKKQIGNNQWKLEYIYSYKGYVSFESRRKPSEWLSQLYPLWLLNG
ncbi:hypothetical protein [Enterococcus sp. LJL51]|uniref:hypothetical protein n=1 Tax=Enterococcus sp. LJL51 TaxID=3416656 RepID=UPI003CF39A1D